MSELDPVTQKFIADMGEYVRPIEDAAAQTEVLAEAVRQTDDALGTLRNDAAEAGAAMQELAAGEDEAAASSAALDHELHDQTESYFALAAAADAAGVSVDEFTAADRLANLESGGLEATLQGLRDMLGDAGLGESLLVTHTGLNQFRIDTEDVAKATRDARFSEEAFRSSMLDANEASIAARVAMDGYRDSIGRLGQAIADMEAGHSGAGGGGFLASFLRSVGGSGSGGAFSWGTLLGNVGALSAGIVAIAPAILAILVGINALTAGFSAALIGVGAFAVFAVPALEKVMKVLTGTNAKSTLHGVSLQMYDDIEGLIKEFDKLQNALSPAIMGVFNQVIKNSGPLLNDLAQFAKAAAGPLEELAKQFGAAVSSPAFARGVQQLLPYIRDSIPAIAHGLWTLGVAISNFFTALSAKDVAQGIQGFFQMLADVINALTFVVQRTAHNWSTFSGEIVRGWQNMRQWTLDAWHAIDQVFNNIIHAYQNVEHAGDNFSHAVGTMYNTISRYFNDIILFAARMATDVASFFKRMENDIKQVVSAIITAVANFISRVISDIANFLSRLYSDWVTGWDHVVAYVKTIPGKIVSALSSLPGQLLRIGINAIDGLLHGLESAGGGVLSWARSFASTLSGIFSSVLHILSPSMVFYGHGVNIMQGLLNGLESKRGELVALMKDLGATTSGSLVSTASQNIVQHQVTVNLANVMSGPAQQQALQRHVQAAVLGFANQNAGSMLVLPGRRG